MSSRDGRSFHRWKEAFIRPGMPEEDYWVKHDNFQNWGIVETTSDLGVPQLSFYVFEGPQDAWLGRRPRIERHITRFRLHTVRIDRFVSLNAPLDGGECVTRPIVFEGDELALNFSTSAAGCVRVEIQDGNGKPVNGFRLNECPRILGNKIKHIVKWKNGSDVNKLAGRPIRIRFELRDADLFSFRFIE